MKKTLKFMGYALILFVLVMSYLVVQNHEKNKTKLARIKACIDQKMPELVKTYEAQGLKIGDHKIWLDWMDPEEYATYDLLKDGKPLENRFAVISTDMDHQTNQDQGCKMSETTVK